MSGFPTRQYFYIQSSVNGSVLDIAGSSTMANSEVVLYQQKSNDNDSQLWYVDDGFIVNKKSNLVLDVRGGSIKSSSVLIQYDRKDEAIENQQFTYDNGSIYPTSIPDLVLDIKGGETRDNTTIILYKRKDDDNDNQQWTLVSAGHIGGDSMQNSTLNTLRNQFKHGHSNASSGYGYISNDSDNTSNDYGRTSDDSSYGQRQSTFSTDSYDQPSSRYGRDNDNSSYDNERRSGYGQGNVFKVNNADSTNDPSYPDAPRQSGNRFTGMSGFGQSQNNNRF